MIIYLILLVVSIFTSSLVDINYNISDYLGEDTQTKIAINIIEDEFSMTGNLKVMLSNIDKADAKSISKELKNIDNVIMVSFDENDEQYYNNNSALYIILIDGDDYSKIAEDVTKDVKDLVNNYNYDAIYSGDTIAKQNLKSGITNEVVYIIIFAIALVFMILLITSSSYLEPILLLVVFGVALFINMGTNFIFKEISYITNSIGALLQLALSIDYSIVILHRYKKELEQGNSKQESIKTAIESSL